MEQFYAPGIMFAITVIMTSLLSVPVTRFVPKNKLFRFYYNGAWGYLVMVAAFAGAGNTLMLLGVDALPTANMFLTAIIATFAIFIMFAWFRLCGVALWEGAKRLRRYVARNKTPVTAEL